MPHLGAGRLNIGSDNAETKGLSVWALGMSDDELISILLCVPIFFISPRQLDDGAAAFWLAILGASNRELARSTGLRWLGWPAGSTRPAWTDWTARYSRSGYAGAPLAS